MCGIVGIWNLNGDRVDAGELDAFTDSLAHRGPDGRGTFIDRRAGVGLGHRRLAILDLSNAARQPMAYANERYWITYNGEIYNFLELRETLAGLGHAFRTRSDTEVILAAYAQWGEESLLKFNGMWAFAIWDQQEQKLFLARNRFGVKPLHYIFDGKRFAFASEMKAFLALPWFDVRFDPETVALAVTTPWNVEGTEHCLLKGVNRLPGGFSMTVKRAQPPCIRRWWNTLDHLVDAPRRYEDQVEQYRETFFDACRIRMRSDVPVATSLSGGLDSGSVLCAVSEVRRREKAGYRLADNWQTAFVASYRDTRQDETNYAVEVARAAGIQPFVFDMQPAKVVEHLDRILFQYEDISDIHIGPWEIYRQQREHGIVVSLDGHAGDEALAGYWNHIRDAAIKDALWPMPRPFRFAELYRTLLEMYVPEARHLVPKPGALIRRHLVVPIGMAGKQAVKSFAKKLGVGSHAAGSDGRRGWFRITPRTPVFPVLEADKPYLEKRSALFQALYSDFHAINLPTNLRTYDRMSMAHGVESRAPFCDWRLVVFTFSLPETSIVGKGFTKRILRDAMKGLLPDSVRLRRVKLGFANPLDDWLFKDLRAFYHDSIHGSSFLQSEIWSGETIARAFENAWTRQDFGMLKGIWIFVLADHLMRIFTRQKTELSALHLRGGVQKSQ